MLFYLPRRPVEDGYRVTLRVEYKFVQGNDILVGEEQVQIFQAEHNSQLSGPPARDELTFLLESN
jgi:hypothetical protein